MRKLLAIAALALAACGGSSDSTPTPTTVATPAFSPAAGVYTTAQSVSITCATAGAAIHYTTDGSTPTATSTTYTSPIAVATTTTIKAMATATGLTSSGVATAAYTIDATATPAAAPTFSPAAGTYATAQSVTISTTTAGATIHYTTNGSTPTTASTAYTTPVAVGTTTTLKAIAAGGGHTASPVSTAAYVISGGGGTDFATVCSEVMSAQFGLMSTCYKMNPSLFTATGPYQWEGCAGMQAGITAGRILYDATQGAACAAAFQALTCANLTPEGGMTDPAACTAALVGTVANGGSCYSSEECANGSCSSEYTNTCPGTCQALIAAGGNCSSGECAAGLTCDYSGMTPTCKTPSAAGGTCPCQDSLWCDTGVCKAPIAAGGACSLTAYSVCAVGYECVGTTSGTCQALVGLGGACSATAPCGTGYLCAGGTCASWPTLGQACGAASYYQCIGAYCDMAVASPICKAYVADGGACVPANYGMECASGNCDGATSKCTRNYCAP